MADLSVDELVQKALTLGILQSEQLQDVWSSFGTQNIEVGPFVQALLRQGHLTKYQVDRLTSGESGGFYFGDYKVLYPVGAGTFARVYRAVHPKTGKVVAIKVLRSRFSSDPVAIDLFVREAELGMSFRHPNIVSVFDIQSEKDVHYMVMDFIEGQTLREFVNIRKKVDPKVATRIVTDICLGLDYAFKRGHLHRDLKMTNVLLSSAGKSVLVDFGLASSEKENNPDRRNQRAIDYAALERSTGVRRDDKRSDLFFLGTIFYHMLTGFPPLVEARDRAKRLDKTRFMNIKPITEKDPTVPFAVSFIVDKAMNLDPDKRYQSPAGMLVDLEVAVKKLEAGTADEQTGRQNRLASASSLSLASVAKKESVLATIMVVEANPEMQNIFRQSLKKTGYRVLLLSSAERALERFGDHDQDVDCVLFNAQSLGSQAVVAFNELANDRLTMNTPAILLLDENQVKWAARAQRDKHRLAVGMPITMKRLQEVIAKLIADKKRAETEEDALSVPNDAAAPSDIGFKDEASVSDLTMAPAATADDLDAIRIRAEADDEEDAAERAAFLAGEMDHAPASPTQSNINLADETEPDTEYIAYVEGGGAGSMAHSGEFTAELFDAALDDAVDTMTAKVNALIGQMSDDSFDAGLSRDSFLNPNKAADADLLKDPPADTKEDEDGEIDYIEDDDL